MSEGPKKIIEDITEGFAEHGYICSEQIATAVYLASELEKPILIEGPPGVGKTELANTAAMYFKKEMIRLQCYEGLDESKALYEWRYGKQLLYTQILKEQMQEVLEGAKGLKESLDRLMKFEDIFFSEDFLETSKSNIEKAFEAIETGWLRESRFLIGDTMTIADISAYVEIGQLQSIFTNVFNFEPYPNIRKWLKEMQNVDSHDDIHVALFELGDISKESPPIEVIINANKKAFKVIQEKLITVVDFFKF